MSATAFQRKRREIAAREAAEKTKAEKPLEKMTVKELKEYAKSNGIELGEASKKDEILAVLLNQSGEEEPEGDGDGTDSE